MNSSFETHYILESTGGKNLDRGREHGFFFLFPERNIPRFQPEVRDFSRAEYSASTLDLLLFRVSDTPERGLIKRLNQPAAMDLPPLPYIFFSGHNPASPLPASRGTFLKIFHFQ